MNNLLEQLKTGQEEDYTPIFLVTKTENSSTSIFIKQYEDKILQLELFNKTNIKKEEDKVTLIATSIRYKEKEIEKDQLEELLTDPLYEVSKGHAIVLAMMNQLKFLSSLSEVD